jgi:hypothetical protein
MTRNHSQNPLFTTLGFFMQGLPAIFVQSEIVFIRYPSMSHYIETAAETRSPDFSTEAILKGYELFITFNHELRHFHDALLSRPLFKLFMLQNARLWHVLQLPSHISNLTETDLPFREGKAIRASVTPFGRFLIDEIRSSDRACHEQQQRLWKPRRCLGCFTISLVDLLEANAVATELLYLLVAHDMPSAEQYYRRVICHLPPEYNKLLKKFVDLAGDFVQALVALHLAVVYCLYGSDDPVARFCVVADEYANRPDTFSDHYNPQAVSHLFECEVELEKWAKDHKLVSSTPEGDVPVGPREGWLGEMDTFNELIYGARKALIDKYVFNFRMNASHYFKRTNELPLPPVVFWPCEVRPDGQAMVVPEGIFRDISTELYMIRGGKDREGDGNVILAGIGPYMTRKPFLAYEHLDMHMLAYYWYRMLFVDHDSEVYSPAIDEMYKDAFAQFFHVAGGGRP